MAIYKAVILSGKAFEKADHTTNIKIRITHRGKQIYVSTKYFVPVSTEKKSYWDKTLGLAKSFPEAKFINGQIHNTINGYMKAEAAMGDSVQWMSVEQLKKELLKNNSSKTIDFFEFADQLIAKLNKQGKYNTAIWHGSSVHALKSFVRSDTLDALSVSTYFLRQFEAYLLKGDDTLIAITLKNGQVKHKVTRKPISADGVNNYMRSFRSLFNHLRDEYNDESVGLIRVPNYPFKNYEMKTVKRRNQGKCLSAEEMKKLIEYQPTDRFEIYAKDMFLLMFYLIGINTKDLFFLPKQTGERVVFSRFKTLREYSIRLEPEARHIAEKYADNSFFINAVNRYSTYRNFTKGVNLHLKKLAASLGFDLKLATNYARHTWATIARNDCRIAKDDVALCLGHEDADNKITDVYITYDYSIIDECNRKVIDFVLPDHE